MTEEEFAVVLKELLPEIRSLNAKIKAIDTICDTILKTFKDLERRSPLLQETHL